MLKWFNTSNQNGSAELDADSLHTSATPADLKQFGLENFGNICYANSVLQALYFCNPFRELVLQSEDAWSSAQPVVAAPPPPPPVAATSPQRPGQVRRKSTRSISESNAGGVYRPSNEPRAPTLFSALRALFLQISTNPVDKGTIAPRIFVDKLKEENELFRNTYQQDAHEFLNFLLNKIIEEIESAGAQQSSGPVAGSSRPNNHSSLVHKLFEGSLTSETRCLTCESISSRDETFLDLSIDIEKNSSVSSCLRQFSASEMLCQKNKFFCDACCDLQEAEKRLKIKDLPNVLALHLKRFKYQEDAQKYVKLAYRVAFPLELKLFNTIDDSQFPDRLFELCAFVVHIGNGPHHGHYVTVVKTRGAWLVLDDETVETIEESEIPKFFGESASGTAYVLYYQAVDLEPESLGLPYPSWEDIIPSLNRHSLLSPSRPPGLTEDVLDEEQTLSSERPLSMASDDAQSNVGGSISRRSSIKSGIRDTMRHAPSLKMRRPGTKANEKPPSPVIRPVTSQSLSGTTETSHIGTTNAQSPSDVDPSRDSGKPNDRKLGAWFKRRRDPASTSPNLDSANVLPSPIASLQPQIQDNNLPPLISKRGDASQQNKNNAELAIDIPKQRPRTTHGQIETAAHSFVQSPTSTLQTPLSITSTQGRSGGHNHPKKRNTQSSEVLRPQTADAKIERTAGDSAIGVDPPPLPSPQWGEHATRNGLVQRRASSNDFNSAAHSHQVADQQSASSQVPVTSAVPQRAIDSKKSTRKISLNNPLFGFSRRNDKTDEERQRKEADRVRKDEEKAKKKAAKVKTDSDVSIPMHAGQTSGRMFQI